MENTTNSACALYSETPQKDGPLTKLSKNWGVRCNENVYVELKGSCLDIFKNKRSYYDNYNNPQQRVMGIVEVVTDYEEGEQDIKFFSFAIKTATEKIVLGTKEKSIALEWINDLKKNETIVVRPKFGLLVPLISFPTCEEQWDLIQMQRRDKDIMSAMSAVIAALVTTAAEVIPFAQAIMRPAAAVLRILPSIFQLFRQNEQLDFTLSKITERNRLDILSQAMGDVRSEIEATRCYYQRLIWSDSDISYWELTYTIHNYRKILYKFCNGCLPDYPLVVAPYFLGFATLYIMVTKRSIGLDLSLDEEMMRMKTALEYYKEEATKLRIDAVKTVEAPKKYERIGCLNKVIDEYHPGIPSAASGREGTNFQYERQNVFGNLPGCVGTVKEKYITGLKTLFEGYFDSAIGEVEKVLAELEKFKRCRLGLDPSLRTADPPPPPVRLHPSRYNSVSGFFSTATDAPDLLGEAAMFVEQERQQNLNHFEPVTVPTANLIDFGCSLDENLSGW